ncbi:hypothetical protein HMPREF1608_01472 [Escherichia coli 908525]|uniref:Uncharacterized protein n=1 Tax=Escherichia coli (strain SMS-3-5 / SECEC) TaxID=439855 RepID=B1LFG6_ECOSM|nr:hypothetical protein EcSMS35_1724 [Escherichia coli SMS-3-5]ESD75881.1 hypothetical protein HMPREF1608_01472 [Escherichia coli 908525]
MLLATEQRSGKLIKAGKKIFAWIFMAALCRRRIFNHHPRRE